MKRQRDNCRFTVSGAKRYKLLDLMIDRGIECDGIIDTDEQLCLYTHRKNKPYIISACSKYGCEYAIDEDGVTKARRYIAFALLHSGLVLGIALSLILCSVFSSMILRIKIDNADEQIKADILSVLDTNGLHIGSFKSDFDFVKLERELNGKVPGISWAGISVQGSTLVVDTIDNIPKPRSDNSRLPCNVVALCDCTVEKAQVFCGDLNVTIGSGVRAGDILISGERKKLIKADKDDKETEVTQYMRASGHVYGEFEKQAEFFFPYEEAVNTPTGKTMTVSYLNIFDADIPLFFKDIEGNYIYKAIREPLEVFGCELPVAITEVEYSEYVEAINTYTDEEINKKIEKSIQNYEASFLSTYEIRDKQQDISKTDKGVTLKLKYTLYGEIGEQADIYLNKE
ncbi:MAG: sporulation protein YqfD [Ruminococcus sp.]|nr:sporulation protein YqfD [Ruminococcus sp.]